MTILDLIFPKYCVCCHKFGLYLCPSCQKKIVYIKENICPVCERPSIFGMTHPVCQTHYSLDGLFSACVYDGVIKKTLHQYKYQPFLSDLSKLLIKTVKLSIKINQNNLIVKFLKEKEPLIIPIPLYKSRQNERGFNQAGIIGKLIAREFNLTYCPDLLVRIKPTKPQARLNSEQRKINIQDAFKVNPLFKIPACSCLRQQPLAGRHNSSFNILLIDDIWTTGITLKTCGNLLKRAGLGQVWALTLAR